MKFSITIFIILWISYQIPVFAQQGVGTPVDTILENADATQAMVIANQWKWSKKEIKSYVTPQEVVFKFPDGKEKKVPLPNDKFLVAVAPYEKQTHK